MSDADASQDEIMTYIEEASEATGIPASLLRRVVQVESGGDPKVKSPAGAQGLMQLMPATARAMGVKDPSDPRQNILGGAKYLRQMLDRYQGDTRLALMAYNWGPGNVDKFQAGQITQMPAETRNYLAKVLGPGSSPWSGLASPPDYREEMRRQYALPEPEAELVNQRYLPLPEQPARDVFSLFPSRQMPAPEPEPEPEPEGLPFVDAGGTARLAHPESPEETAELNGMSRFSLEDRGRLIGVRPMIEAVRRQTQGNDFLKYPDFYDNDIRALVRRVKLDTEGA